MDILSRDGGTLFSLEADEGEAPPTIRQAVEAAIAEGIPLANADLRGAFLGGARLEGANLLEADLTGAYLGGARIAGADLRRANLTGTCFLGCDIGNGNRDKLADMENAILNGTQWGEIRADDHRIAAPRGRFSRARYSAPQPKPPASRGCLRSVATPPRRAGPVGPPDLWPRVLASADALRGGAGHSRTP